MRMKNPLVTFEIFPKQTKTNFWFLSNGLSLFLHFDSEILAEQWCLAFLTPLDFFFSVHQGFNKEWKHQHDTNFTALECTFLPYRGITGATIALRLWKLPSDWRDASLHSLSTWDNMNGGTYITSSPWATTVTLSKTSRVAFAVAVASGLCWLGQCWLSLHIKVI